MKDDARQDMLKDLNKMFRASTKHLKELESNNRHVTRENSLATSNSLEEASGPSKETLHLKPRSGKSRKAKIQKSPSEQSEVKNKNLLIKQDQQIEERCKNLLIKQAEHIKAKKALTQLNKLLQAEEKFQLTLNIKQAELNQEILTIKQK